MDEIGFQIAFGVRHADDFNVNLDDLDYVEWAPLLEISDAAGLNKVTKPLGYHKCTDEDFDMFNKP